MKNELLKEDILNGEKAIFRVDNPQENFIRYEILGYKEILDLLIESNEERLLDLATLYCTGELLVGNEVYNLICGNLMIAKLIESVSINIQEDIEFSIELEEEKYNEFERI